MKFIINNKILFSALKKIEKTIDEKNSFSMNSILIYTIENKLFLYSSDNYFKVIIKVDDVQFLKFGKIKISSKILINLIKKIKKTERIEFELIKDNILSIKGQNFEYKINILENLEKDIEFDSKNFDFSIKGNVFKEVTISNLLVVSNDNNYLNKVDFLVEKKLKIISSDSYRICFSEVEINKMNPELRKSFVLNKKTLEQIAKFLDDEDYKIKITENKMSIFSDSEYLEVNLSNKELFNFSNLKYLELPNVLFFNNSEMQNVLNRIQIINDENNKFVELFVRSNEIEIKSNSVNIGYAKEKIGIEFIKKNSEEFQIIKINSEFLKDTIKVSSSKQIIFSFDLNDNFVALKTIEEKNIRIITIILLVE